jgi:type VI secretion system protein ImpA
MATTSYYNDLAGPVAGAAPCGPDLDASEGALTALASRGVVGQATGILNPSLDWRKLREDVLELCRRSHDLRLLPYLCAAVLRTEGLQSFLSILQLAKAWLESYPDAVHPLIEDDFNPRLLVLANLQDPYAVLDALRRVPLAGEGPASRISVRAWRIARGEAGTTTNDAAGAGGAELESALQALGTDAAKEIEAVIQQAIRNIQSIETLCSGTEAGSGEGELRELKGGLMEILEILATKTGSPAATDSGLLGTDLIVNADSPSPGYSGQIRSRNDAIRALSDVQAFFKSTEPSSPVPLLVERAKRLVNCDFMEVLEDLMPDRVSEAKVAAGVKDKS